MAGFLEETEGTANDRAISESIALAIILERLARRVSLDVADRLREMRADLLTLVVRMDPTALRYEANRRNRLAALVEEAQKLVSATYVDIASLVDDHLLDIATLTQDSGSKLLALLLLIRGLSRQMDNAELRAARDRTMIEGATIRDWWARQSGDVQFRVQRALEGAMLVETLDQQPTLKDLVERVRSDEPGTLFAPLLRNAESVIFSAVHAVATMVRMETAKRHPEFFAALQHISVLDHKTSEVCLSRSGRVWSLDGTPIGHRLPFRQTPLHFRCRSHIVPVLHPYSALPARIQRRVKEADFPDNAAREPDLAAWLALYGVTRSDEPMDIEDARAELGV
jgi:hypothetical protein